MDFLIKHLTTASELSNGTLGLICVMAGIGMYFVRNHLVMPALIVVLGPITVGFAVLANYALLLTETFDVGRFDQWLICTISAATIGIVLTLILAALLARLQERMQANTHIAGRT